MFGNQSIVQNVEHWCNFTMAYLWQKQTGCRVISKRTISSHLLAHKLGKMSDEALHGHLGAQPLSYQSEGKVLLEQAISQLN